MTIPTSTESIRALRQDRPDRDAKINRGHYGDLLRELRDAREERDLFRGLLDTGGLNYSAQLALLGREQRDRRRVEG